MLPALQLALNAGRKTVVVSAVHTLRLLDITNPTAPGQRTELRHVDLHYAGGSASLSCFLACAKPSR